MAAMKNNSDKQKKSWIDLVDSLNVDDEIAAKQSNSPIANLLPTNYKYLSRPDRQRLDVLCQKALKNRIFARKLILTFVNSSNKHDCLFTGLMPYYDQREYLIKNDREKFCNLVFLLGEAYKRELLVRMIEKELVICLNRLLKIGGETEIVEATTQIIANGQLLYSRAVPGFDDIFIHAREALIEQTLSANCRKSLLYIIEMNNMKFQGFSAKVREFYDGKLIGAAKVDKLEERAVVAVEVQEIVNENLNDSWVKRVDRLDITDENDGKNPRSCVANLITRACDELSREDKQHLDRLANEALKSITFALKFIMTFAHPTNKKSCFFSALEPYYQKREELLKKQPKQFYNLVFMFGEVYRRLIMLRVIEQPLIDCLRTLLELAGDDGIELAATQVIVNGQLLHLRLAESLTDLFICARKVLSSRDLTKRSRGMLLLMIDVYGNGHFQPLKHDLQRLYIKNLGLDTLLAMQQNAKTPIITLNHQKIVDNSKPKPVKTILKAIQGAAVMKSAKNNGKSRGNSKKIKNKKSEKENINFRAVGHLF